MNEQRLLNVARALRESDNPHSFAMSWVRNGCGTPACAMGHYAARRDLQQVFQLPSYDAAVLTNEPWECRSPRRIEQRPIMTNSLIVGVWGASRVVSGWSDHVATHFGITHEQVDELFSSRGCGNAKTAYQAAQYIEKFVAKNGSRP